MRVRRFAALIATAAVVVGLYAAYDPVAVGALWPAAGPLAMRLHALLPIGSRAGTGAAPTATAPSKPPVVVVVGHAARKDLPWKLDEIGTAQAIASVALRPHFDATVDKVLVADGAAVKAGDTLIELDARQVRGAARRRQGAARQGPGRARTGPARRDALHRPRRPRGDAAAQSRQRQDRGGERARGDPRRPGGDREPAKCSSAGTR